MTNSAPAAARTPLRELAVRTDTELARLDEVYARLANERANLLNALHGRVGDTRRVVGRRRMWCLSDAEVVDGIRAGRFEIRPWDVVRVAELISAYAVVEAAMPRNRDEAQRLDDVWAASGYWARFFVVRNSNGHIHYDISSSRCSRTATTSHGWNPELSGATEAEAVAALGPHMCTICFPSAPVEWTVGNPKPARCAGSGTYVRSDRRYAECGTCHEYITKTPSGYLRAHKPAETA